jgi:hypothetical protein
MLPENSVTKGGRCCETKEKDSQPGVVMHTCNPSTQRRRQEDLEF